MSPAADSGALFARIDTCLAHCGKGDFAVHLAALVCLAGPRQLMIFELAQDRAACLVSANFSQLRLGEVLAPRYLDGWFRLDPLLPRLLALPPGSCEVVEMREPFGEMPPDYRDIFFRQPKLSGKLAVLLAGATRRLAVYLYQGADQRARPDPALARVIGRLALMHFDGLRETTLPAPLAVLSSREAEVCTGILAGKKAEIIAAEIGVSVTTIATYRRRAYEKLGISSRGALFALCR